MSEGAPLSPSQPVTTTSREAHVDREGGMATSRKSNPLAKEKEARSHPDQDTAAATVSCPRSASPLQSSTPQMVEMNTEDTPLLDHGVTAPSKLCYQRSWSSEAKLCPLVELIDSAAEHGEAAGPQPQSNATADANADTDTTTEILKSEGPRASRSSEPPSRYNSWRSWHFVQKFGRWLLGDEVENPREDFTRQIRISYKVDNTDVPEYSKAVFDTQCPKDLISAYFLKNTWNLDFDDEPKSWIATSYKGVAVHSIGQVKLAWSSHNTPGWVPGKLSIPPKTFRAIFEVVDTGEWDIIIGQESIDQHKLLTFNHRIFGLFKAHRPAIPRGESKL
jgi:hypothetical protein